MINLEQRILATNEIEQAFKSSSALTIAEFLIDKPIGPFQVHKVEKKAVAHNPHEQLRFDFAGTYLLTDGSFLKSHPFTLTIAPHEHPHIFLYQVADGKKIIGKGVLPINETEYHKLAHTNINTNLITLIYALGKSVIDSTAHDQQLQLLEFSFDGKTVVLRQRKEEEIEQPKLETYLDQLSNRMYGKWIEQRVVEIKYGSRFVRINGNVYPIDEEIELRKLYYLIGYGTIQRIRTDINNGAAIDLIKREISEKAVRYSTTAKSILYYTAARFPAGNHYKPNTIQQILGHTADEHAQASDSFGFDVSKSAGVRRVKQAYNKIFENTIRLYFKST